MLARYLPALNLDRKPSFLWSNQARLKSRLLSYASCFVFSQSSFFMIQIYRCYKMCMLLYLFIEPSYFSYLISYTSCMIIVQNEWHIFIRPSCTPCCGCVPYTIFWVFYLWQVHKEVSENKATACLTWNSIVGALGFCDRASWANCEVREKTNKMQQMFIFNNISTCYGHHYAHLQENKTYVTACGVLRWFCWMWLVAVVGALPCGVHLHSARTPQGSAPQPLRTTSSRTSAAHHMQ